MEKEQDIIVFKDNDFSMEVNLDIKNDTVWITQDQMAKLFNVDRTRIVRHIGNIYNEQELNPNSTSAENAQVEKEGLRTVKRNIKVFNLDVVISVGYRVRSKRGIIFRKWALKVLKEYMLKGYLINQKQLIDSKEHYTDFTKSVKFISELYKRKDLNKIESNSLFSVINKYSLALDTLEKYDHRILTINNTTEDLGDNRLLYKHIISEISLLPEYSKSTLFGREKDKSFEGSLSSI